MDKAIWLGIFIIFIVVWWLSMEWKNAIEIRQDKKRNNEVQENGK
jgi:hypothetical protein